MGASTGAVINFSAQDLGLSAYVKNLQGVLGNLGHELTGFLGVWTGWDKVNEYVQSSVNQFATFNKFVTRAGAISNATASEVKLLGDTALQLGRVTEFTASQVAEGMNSLALSGFKAEEMIGAMPGLLAMATAGLLNIESASKIASEVMRSFHLEASKMNYVAGVMTATFTSTNTVLSDLDYTVRYVGADASELGVTLSQVAAAAGLLGNVGVKGSMAGTGLREFISRLAAGLGGMKQDLEGGKKALQSLGLAWKDVSDDAGQLNLVKAVGALENAFNKMGMTAEQKLKVLRPIFGVRAGTQVTALIAQGAEVLRAKELEVAFGGAKQQLDGLIERAQRLPEGIHGIKISFEEVAKDFITIGSEGGKNITRLSAQMRELGLSGGAFNSEAGLMRDIVQNINGKTIRKEVFTPINELNLGTLRTLDALMRLRERLAEVGTEAQKLVILEDIFGADPRMVKQAYEAFERGGSALKTFSNQLLRSTSALDIQRKQLDTLHGSMEMMSSAFRSLQTDIGGLVSPIIRVYSMAITAAVGMLTAGQTIEGRIAEFQENLGGIEKQLGALRVAFDRFSGVGKIFAGIVATAGILSPVGAAVVAMMGMMFVATTSTSAAIASSFGVSVIIFGSLLALMGQFSESLSGVAPLIGNLTIQFARARFAVASFWSSAYGGALALISGMTRFEDLSKRIALVIQVDGLGIVSILKLIRDEGVSIILAVNEIFPKLTSLGSAITFFTQLQANISRTIVAFSAFSNLDWGSKLFKEINRLSSVIQNLPGGMPIIDSLWDYIRLLDPAGRKGMNFASSIEFAFGKNSKAGALFLIVLRRIQEVLSGAQQTAQQTGFTAFFNTISNGWKYLKTFEDTLREIVSFIPGKDMFLFHMGDAITEASNAFPRLLNNVAAMSRSFYDGTTRGEQAFRIISKNIDRIRSQISAFPTLKITQSGGFTGAIGDVASHFQNIWTWVVKLNSTIQSSFSRSYRIIKQLPEGFAAAKDSLSALHGVADAVVNGALSMTFFGATGEAVYALIGHFHGLGTAIRSLSLGGIWDALKGLLGGLAHAPILIAKNFNVLGYVVKGISLSLETLISPLWLLVEFSARLAFGYLPVIWKLTRGITEGIKTAGTLSFGAPVGVGEAAAAGPSGGVGIAAIGAAEATIMGLVDSIYVVGEAILYVVNIAFNSIFALQAILTSVITEFIANIPDFVMELFVAIIRIITGTGVLMLKLIRDSIFTTISLTINAITLAGESIYRLVESVVRAIYHVIATVVYGVLVRLPIYILNMILSVNAMIIRFLGKISVIMFRFSSWLVVHTLEVVTKISIAILKITAMVAALPITLPYLVYKAIEMALYFVARQIGPGVSDISDTVMRVIYELGDLASETVKDIMKGVVSEIKNFVYMIEDVILAVLFGLPSIVLTIMNLIHDAIIGTFNYIVSSIEGILATLPFIVETNIIYAISIVAKLLESVINIFGSITTTIASVLVKIVAGLIKSVLLVVVEIPFTLMRTIVGIMRGLVFGITGAIYRLFWALRTVVFTVIAQIYVEIVVYFNRLGSMLGNAIPAIMEEINIVAKIALDGLRDLVVAIVIDFPKWVIGSIEKAVGYLYDTILKLPGQIVDKLLAALNSAVDNILGIATAILGASSELAGAEIGGLIGAAITSAMGKISAFPALFLAEMYGQFSRLEAGAKSAWKKLMDFNWEEYSNKIYDNFKIIGKKILGVFVDIGLGLASVITKMPELIVNTIVTLRDMIKSAWTSVRDFLSGSNIGENIAGYLKRIGSSGKAALVEIRDSVLVSMSEVFSAIRGSIFVLVARLPNIIRLVIDSINEAWDGLMDVDWDSVSNKILAGIKYLGDAVLDGFEWLLDAPKKIAGLIETVSNSLSDNIYAMFSGMSINQDALKGVTWHPDASIVENGLNKFWLGLKSWFDKFSERFKKIWEDFKGFDVWGSVMPVLMKLYDKIIGWMDKAIKAVGLPTNDNGATDTVRKVLIGVFSTIRTGAELAKQILPVVREHWGKLWSSIWSYMTKKLGFASDAASAGLDPLAGIVMILGNLAGAGADSLQPIIDGITAFKKDIDHIGVASTVDKLLTSIENYLNGDYSSFMSNVVELLNKSFDTVFALLWRMMNSIWNGIMMKLAARFPVLAGVITALAVVVGITWTAFKVLYFTLVPFGWVIKQVWNGINGLIDVLEIVLRPFIALAKIIGGGIIGAIYGFVRALTSMLSYLASGTSEPRKALMESLSKLWTWVADWGEYFVDTVKKPFKNIEEWIRTSWLGSKIFGESSAKPDYAYKKNAEGAIESVNNKALADTTTEDLQAMFALLTREKEKHAAAADIYAKAGLQGKEIVEAENKKITELNIMLGSLRTTLWSRGTGTAQTEAALKANAGKSAGEYKGASASLTDTAFQAMPAMYLLPGLVNMLRGSGAGGVTGIAGGVTGGATGGILANLGARFSRLFGGAGTPGVAGGFDASGAVAMRERLASGSGGGILSSIASLFGGGAGTGSSTVANTATRSWRTIFENGLKGIDSALMRGWRFIGVDSLGTHFGRAMGWLGESFHGGIDGLKSAWKNIPWNSFSFQNITTSLRTAATVVADRGGSFITSILGIPQAIWFSVEGMTKSYGALAKSYPAIVGMGAPLAAFTAGLIATHYAMKWISGDQVDLVRLSSSIGVGVKGIIGSLGTLAGNFAEGEFVAGIRQFGRDLKKAKDDALADLIGTNRDADKSGGAMNQRVGLTGNRQIQQAKDIIQGLPANEALQTLYTNYMKAENAMQAQMKNLKMLDTPYGTGVGSGNNWWELKGLKNLAYNLDPEANSTLREIEETKKNIEQFKKQRDVWRDMYNKNADSLRAQGSVAPVINTDGGTNVTIQVTSSNNSQLTNDAVDAIRNAMNITTNSQRLSRPNGPNGAPGVVPYRNPQTRATPQR